MQWIALSLLFVLLTSHARWANAATSFHQADAWLDRELDRDDVLLLARTHSHGERRAHPVALSVASFVTQTSGTGPSEHQSTGWGFAVTLSVPTARVDPPRERAPPVSTTRRSTPKGLGKRCVHAAWQAAGIGNDKKLDGMTKRARLSAALPEVRLRASRGIDAQARVDTDYDSERFADTSSTNLWLEARLTWRLDRALFADEEIQIERLLHDRRELRLRIAHKVLDALSHWLRAKAELVNPIDDEARSGASLRLAEAEATLDALTDGWFSAANDEGG